MLQLLSTLCAAIFEPNLNEKKNKMLLKNHSFKFQSAVSIKKPQGENYFNLNHQTTAHKLIICFVGHEMASFSRNVIK
jgi:hypothetical protein